MANNIKGITIKIGGNTTELVKALSDVNKQTSKTKSELKQVEKLLKLDPKNTEALAQKQKLLKKAISETEEKLNVLKAAEVQVEEQFRKGEVGEAQYRALKREIAETETTLKNLKKQSQESNDTLKKVGDTLGTVGEKSTAIGEKMLPISAGIAAIGGAGVAAAMDLDDGYDTIITKTGATGDALEELNKIAEELFTELPIEMEEAGTAVGEINTRFGATGEELKGLSEEFIKFSQINETDLNGSIAKTDKIMEQYNIDISETGNVLGLITKKSQETGINVDTLMDSLQKNGAVFKEMGLNMVQSTNLLAQFEANGVNADTAVAGLRKSLKAYTDQGKSVDEALSLTIDSIKNAATETEALSIAQEIFGTKGAAEMATAIREGRIDLDSLSDSMGEYGTVVEETFQATQDPWDEAKVAANNLKLAASDLGGAILQTLQPAISKVVKKVKEFTEWFRGLNDTQKETIIKIAAVVAAIGPALIIFGKLSTGISSIISVFGKISGVFKTTAVAGKGLWGVLAANPIGLIVAAIGALIAGFVLMYAKCEWFREMVNQAFADIKKAVGETIERIKPILQQLGESFKSLMNTLRPVFEALTLFVVATIKSALAALAPILAAVKNVIDFINNIIQAFIALFKGDFDGFSQYLIAALQNVVAFITNIVMGIINSVIAFFGAFGINVKQIFSDIWNGIVGIFTGVGQWFSDRFTEAYTGITNIFASIGQWFGLRWQEVTTALASIPAWFGTQFQSAWSAITNAFSSIGSFFAGIWNTIKAQFSSVGTSIGQAIGGAFRSAMNGALATVENAVNGAIGFINGAIGVINKLPGVSVGRVGTVSLPRLAKGGVLQEGQAIVAEAGPELISMVNGQTIVTPLTGTARNTAIQAAGANGGYNQTVNIYSPKALSPYEVARITKNQTQRMALAMQRG